MAQLVRIGAVVKQRWDLKKDSQSDREESKNEKDGDEEEGFKDSPGESQKKVEEGTPLLTFYKSSCFVFCFLF